MKSFEYWKRRFDQNDLLGFSRTEEGLLWLKLRSIDRKDLITAFCTKVGVACGKGATVEIWKMLNRSRSARERLVEFMRECQSLENARIDDSFETIRSNLYKMNHFHWGGGFRNSLDKAIVTRYVKTKEILPYERLDEVCQSELLEMSRGYLYNSWYNYWSSVLIENLFRRNEDVMPAYGKIKYVDFFVKDFPFDLKVTYIPKEYASVVRKELKIEEPLKKLKRYAKLAKIDYDEGAKDDAKQYEIEERIKDSATREGRMVLNELHRDWNQIVEYIIANKKHLIRWLYENQGDMRFGSENRIFLVLINTEDPNEAWKLKRNTDLIKPAITRWIKGFQREDLQSLLVRFSYKNKGYEAYSDVVFVKR